MPSKVFNTTLAINILFLATGAAQLAIWLLFIQPAAAAAAAAQENQNQPPPQDGQQALRNLLSQQFPLAAGIVNGALVMAAFASTLVGLVSSSARTWLRVGGFMTVLCAVFTLCLGVRLWLLTLRFRDGFFATYLGLGGHVQSLIQKSFQCCGYYNALNPAFIVDATCPNPAAAAALRPCGLVISGFANVFFGNAFTALFGMVGIDVILLLSIACLLKERKERERYRHIDEKAAY